MTEEEEKENIFHKILSCSPLHCEQIDLEKIIRDMKRKEYEENWDRIFKSEDKND